MAETAIASMDESIKATPGLVESEHANDRDADSGQAVILSATADRKVCLAVVLDADHCRTRTLAKAFETGSQPDLPMGDDVVEEGFRRVDELRGAVRIYFSIQIQGGDLLSQRPLRNPGLPCTIGTSYART